LKKRQLIVLILLVISIIGISGCKKEEETIYNRNIVVDNTVLPFYESSWTYNAEPEEQIRTKLYTILNETLANLPGSSEYIIVNHDGEDLTDEFLVEKSPSHNEMKDMIKRIKENGYLVVNKEKYRVTTIEKENFNIGDLKDFCNNYNLHLGIKNIVFSSVYVYENIKDVGFSLIKDYEEGGLTEELEDQFGMSIDQIYDMFNNIQDNEFMLYRINEFLKNRTLFI